MKIDEMYISGLGVFVGEFTESDLKNGIDKKAVAEKMEKTGLKYTNTKIAKNKNKERVLRIWVCNVDDFKLDF